VFGAEPLLPGYRRYTNLQGGTTMSTRGLTFGILFFAAAVVSADAGAAELKVLSVEAMRPALQELAKEFEAASKHKLKIDYAPAAAIEKKIDDEEEYDIVIVDAAITKKLDAAAKIAGGSTKSLAKQSPDHSYDASTTNWTQEPLADKELIGFLTAPKAAAVYKSKGMQPG
jgi:ABC-type molybdate transport system substrate-binding protein